VDGRFIGIRDEFVRRGSELVDAQNAVWKVGTYVELSHPDHPWPESDPLPERFMQLLAVGTQGERFLWRVGPIEDHHRILKQTGFGVEVQDRAPGTTQHETLPSVWCRSALDAIMTPLRQRK